MVWALALERTFLPLLKRRRLPKGGLAVIYDKNEMETSGYAAMLADLTDEPVWLVPCFQNEAQEFVRFINGVMEIQTPSGTWEPIRAAFRYVTQQPWDRIPPVTRTMIFNPTLICLAGRQARSRIAGQWLARGRAGACARGCTIRHPGTGSSPG